MILLPNARGYHRSYSHCSRCNKVIMTWISLMTMVPTIFVVKSLQWCHHYYNSNIKHHYNVALAFTTNLPSRNKKSTSLYHSLVRESTIKHSTDLLTDKQVMGPPVDLQYMCLKVGPNHDDKPKSSGSASTTSISKSSSRRHPPVILLHGLLGHKRNLASLGAALHAQLTKKRDIYAVDLRNHGDNTHDWRDHMSYSHMSMDVINFMNQNKIQKAVLIGHSMGGKLASSMALSHPERVQGLIVLDISPIRYTHKDTAWKSVQDIVDTLDNVDITKFDKKSDLDLHLQESVEDPSLRAFILTSINSVKGRYNDDEDNSAHALQWKINIDAIVQQLNVLAGFDVCYHGSSDDASLQHLQYKGDAFFVNSPISRYIKHSHMETIKRHFPNFMLTTIKGVGHSLHTDSPEATVELLKKYLDR